MPLSSIRTIGLALTVGLSLASCDTYGYGVGLGYGGGYGYDGYDGYGSGLSVGYSSYPYWGWNDGFYYPGAGYYVYDSYRRPYRWTERQQSYWSARQAHWNRADRRELRENWNDFDRRRRR